jgi:alpha-L-fucosidase 2
MFRSILFLIAFATIASAAQVRTDVEFAKKGDVSLTLDASVPDGNGPYPAVIVVHGGGFVRGDKQTYVKPLFKPLTEANFSWFTINYRLAPQYKMPDPVDDVISAIQWVRAHAAEYKVDPKRIALVGESAGAYLVDYAAMIAPKNAQVAAVVSFYGPHDLVFQASEKGQKISEGIQGLTGVNEFNADGQKKLRDLSPYFLIRKNLPPFLLIHGTEDEQVPYQQSVRFRRALLDKGVKVELFTVEGAKHGVGPWEKDPGQQAYKAKLVEWLRAALR